MQGSFLVFANYRYLKVSILLGLVVVSAYVAHEPFGTPNGGSKLGYALGGIGAVLIFWLLWFGVRKRRHGTGRMSLDGWLSAHVYLGLMLAVVVTLHTGFELGLNVHSLAYAIMLLVILSGLVGVVIYRSVPDALVLNRSGITLEQIMFEIADNADQCQEIALGLSDVVNETVRAAIEKARIGGGVMRQISGRDRKCPVAGALARVQNLPESERRDDPRELTKLVGLLARQCELLDKARRDVRYKALLEIWLAFHIPMSFALIAALVAHIVAVFYYW